jgi:hypothetical protein
MEEKSPNDLFVEVRYICYPSGSGSSRMWLSMLPNWMTDRAGDGIMITEIKRVK